MAKEVRRVVSVGFWNDDLVLNEFSPEDKYFMLYLLTNPYTTQLGIYHLPVKKAAFDLGYSIETVNTLLKRFEDEYDIIMRSEETSEIAIRNYLRYGVLKGGKPVEDCLIKDINNVKDKKLLQYIVDNFVDNKPENESVKKALVYIYKLLNNNNYIYKYINENEDSYHESNDESWYDSQNDTSIPTENYVRIRVVP